MDYTENDGGNVTVDVTLPDGSVAMWAVQVDGPTIDRLTDAIEAIIGKPDTITL